MSSSSFKRLEYVPFVVIGGMINELRALILMLRMKQGEDAEDPEHEAFNDMVEWLDNQ